MFIRTRRTHAAGRRSAVAALFCAAVVLGPIRSARAADYLTYRFDNARTGWNPNETRLTPENVGPSSFGKLWARPVIGQIYAQPLYMAAVAIPGRGTHRVVFLATERNMVYAFDAVSTAPPNDQPLWSKQLGPSVPVSVIGCGDIDGPSYGVTSTPVIDGARGVMYVVAKTLEDGAGRQTYRLHALDIHTGAELPRWPAVIQGSVPGASGGARIGFDPAIQHQRPALLLVDGMIWIAFGSHCDQSIDAYHGWVFGMSATDPAAVPKVFCSTPDFGGFGQGGGIWQAGQGLAADADGHLLFATGNGAFTAQSGGRNVGDTFVKLRPKEDAGPFAYSGRLLQSRDLSDAGLSGQAHRWRVLAPGAAASAALDSHEPDYADPGYDDSGTDPYTAAAWSPFPFAPGDAAPSGRAGKPGGIPPNTDFALRIHVGLDDSFTPGGAPVTVLLRISDFSSRLLAVYMNGHPAPVTPTGPWAVSVDPAFARFGGDNVILLIGRHATGPAGFIQRAPRLEALHPQIVQVPPGGMFNGNPDDYYTPSNQDQLNGGDADLGSGGVTVLPDLPGAATPHLAIGAGKDGMIYLLDRDRMGGLATPSRDPSAAKWPLNRSVFSSPGYFEGPSDRFVYYIGNGDTLRQFRLTTAGGSVRLVPDRSATIEAPAFFSDWGASPAVSSDGNRNGIVWALDRSANALRAFDAGDVGRTLYRSTAAAGGRDAPGRVIKFTVPTPVDGMVFVGATNQLLAYGLLFGGPSGDLNGDGRVTLADVVLALGFADGLSTPTAAQVAAADANDDGTIDIADVVRLLRIAIGPG